jgi:hypothetical protein
VSMVWTTVVDPCLCKLIETYGRKPETTSFPTGRLAQLAVTMKIRCH